MRSSNVVPFEAGRGDWPTYWEQGTVLAIGLNSGSSFDVIDVVLVELVNDPDDHPERPKFITGKSYDWPNAVAEIVLRAFENNISIFELTRLNYLAGAVYAEAARDFMRENDLKPGDVEAICYDGQTIAAVPTCQESRVSPGLSARGDWQASQFHQPIWSLVGWRRIPSPGFGGSISIR